MEHYFKNTQLPENLEWAFTLPVEVFKASLILGTIPMILFAIFRDDTIAILGFFYLLFAIPVNLIVLLILVVSSFIYSKYQKAILIKASLLLINIPVAILYFYIAIAIINSTSLNP